MLSSSGASRLALDGDMVRVTAKISDILMDPLKCGKLVKHTPVAGAVGTSNFLKLCREFRVSEPAEWAGTVIVVYKHNSLVSHTTTIKERVSRCGFSWVAPHNDRELGIGGVGGRPDVQVQAVFVDSKAVGSDSSGRADVTPVASIQSTIPSACGLGLLPAVLATSGSSKRNTLPDGDVLPVCHVTSVGTVECRVTLDRPILGIDRGFIERSGGQGHQAQGSDWERVVTHDQEEQATARIPKGKKKIVFVEV